MTIKLKVGDYVKIREDLIGGKNYPTNTGYEIYFNPEMKIYKGKIAKVVKILEKSNIKLDIDNDCWAWAESMLEKIELNKEELFELYLNNKINKKEFKKLIKEVN